MDLDIQGFETTSVTSQTIGTLVSGATTSLVAKNETKKGILQQWLKSSPVDRFWYLGSLNNYTKVPDMIRSFASIATTSLVAKNGTKQLSQPFKAGF